MRVLAPVLLAVLLLPPQAPVAAQPVPAGLSSTTAAPLAPVPEVVVGTLVNELRAAELILDADTIAASLAQSFTAIEGGARVAGAFAYVEPIRRLAERRASVRKLAFDQLRVDVYGASAVVTYRIDKVWTDGGVRHQLRGWCTDVFERRDDGAWLLIHRHRP